jgi:hypothetical protein
VLNDEINDHGSFKWLPLDRITRMQKMTLDLENLEFFQLIFL